MELAWGLEYGREPVLEQERELVQKHEQESKSQAGLFTSLWKDFFLVFWPS